MSAEVHYSDVGVRFILTLQDDDGIINISSASTLQIIFSKPDGTTLTVTGSLYTDGTDGIISYTTVSGDLDQTGNWKLQVYIVIGSYSWHSDTVRFTVFSNLA